jgi:hypothetical protein
MQHSLTWLQQLCRMYVHIWWPSENMLVSDDRHKQQWNISLSFDCIVVHCVANNGIIPLLSDNAVDNSCTVAFVRGECLASS